MSIDVVVQNVLTSDTTPVPAEHDMIRWVRNALSQLKIKSGEVTIRIVDESEVTSLNKQYRQQNKATNVLSFPFAQPPGINDSEHNNILGDIVICAAVVEREQQEQHKAHPAHWAHMIIHGALHLCGYDHQQQAEAEKMEAMETGLLENLGFPGPYTT